MRSESSVLASVAGLPEVEVPPQASVKHEFVQQFDMPQPPYPAVVVHVLHPELQLLHDAAVPQVPHAELKPPYPA